MMNTIINSNKQDSILRDFVIMSQNYDNWERLVKVVLKREQFQQLALESSSEPSFSSVSSSFLSNPTTPIHDHTDWDSLLPSDYEEIISRSVNKVAYASKKELYLSLCNSPILLDGGKMSFQIDKMTGKKCYMIGAMNINNTRIRQAEYSRKSPKMNYNDRFWKFTPHADSRFSTVAKPQIRRSVPDIRGQIETEMLSPKTIYVAYLVFRSTNFNIGEAKGIIKYVNVDKDDEAERRANILQDGDIDASRPDGWMEVRLGMFYNDLGYNGPVEARLLCGYFNRWNRLDFDFTVEGIEFRPTAVADVGFVSKKNVKNRRKWMFSNLTRTSG